MNLYLIKKIESLGLQVPFQCLVFWISECGIMIVNWLRGICSLWNLSSLLLQSYLMLAHSFLEFVPNSVFMLVLRRTKNTHAGGLCG